MTTRPSPTRCHLAWGPTLALKEYHTIAFYAYRDFGLINGTIQSQDIDNVVDVTMLGQSLGPCSMRRTTTSSSQVPAVE
jgi:hypothetical protein